LENAAHHAGITWSRPYTWQWRRWRALRPNERSVGIEIEGYGEFTAKQYRALIWLIPLLALRFNIPIKLLSDPWRGHDPAVNKKHGGDACEIDELQDFRGILGHGAIHYSKVDPGLNFDYDTIAALEPLTIGPASFPENVIWRGDPAQLPGEGMVYA
jgi:N-acetyl-anhydromuramyl-L-alanine amidase AmpD